MMLPGTFYDSHRAKTPFQELYRPVAGGGAGGLEPVPPPPQKFSEELNSAT